MFEWLYKSVPCCSTRIKTDKLPEKAPNEPKSAKSFDISTMFPSIQIKNKLEHTVVQPDSEHMYESRTKSSVSLESLSLSQDESKEDQNLQTYLVEEILNSCKICKKDAEGFCCACKTEKFCSDCFKIFHEHFPKFHVYFSFKTSGSTNLYRQETMNRRLSKLV